MTSEETSDGLSNDVNSGSDTEILSVVNADEIKKPKNDNLKQTVKLDSSWYNQLKYWLIFGLGVSIFLIPFALINYRVLFLIPLGPICAGAAWYVKKWTSKYEDKKSLLR